MKRCVSAPCPAADIVACVQAPRPQVDRQNGQDEVEQQAHHQHVGQRRHGLEDGHHHHLRDTGSRGCFSSGARQCQQINPLAQVTDRPKPRDCSCRHAARARRAGERPKARPCRGGVKDGACAASGMDLRHVRLDHAASVTDLIYRYGFSPSCLRCGSPS